jgi:hypothetical protein
MAGPFSQPSQSGGVDNPPFSTILTALIARIVNGVPSNVGTQVRVVAVPDDRLHEYLAEPGFLIRVRPATPFADSGAGRWGYLVTRQIDVFIITQNLSDPGGRDDLAVAAHCDVEEAVVNALLLIPPLDTTYSTAVGKTIKWVPGGEELVRQMKTDPGLIVSAQSYAIMYPLRVLVQRI